MLGAQCGLFCLTRDPGLYYKYKAVNGAQGNYISNNVVSLPRLPVVQLVMYTVVLVMHIVWCHQNKCPLE